MAIIWLQHNKIRLALHQLRDGDGPSLLLLHALGERSPSAVPAWANAWPGAIHGLDFTGHGDSTVPIGGGYSAEILMADVDVALGHLGPSTIVGRGLGAYIALLIASGRPALVRGVVLADGPGMAGGGVGPVSTSLFALPPVIADHHAVPDPWALIELARDARPADYAASIVRLAFAPDTPGAPITVSARFRPPWLEAVAGEPGVAETHTIDEALAFYAKAR